MRRDCCYRRLLASPRQLGERRVDFGEPMEGAMAPPGAGSGARPANSRASSSASVEAAGVPDNVWSSRARHGGSSAGVARVPFGFRGDPAGIADRFVAAAAMFLRKPRAAVRGPGASLAPESFRSPIGTTAEIDPMFSQTPITVIFACRECGAAYVARQERCEGKRAGRFTCSCGVAVYVWSSIYHYADWKPL